MTQKYNKKLEEITQPEIDRMKKCEVIAYDILNKLREITEIDPCGLEEWQIINPIAQIIRKNYYKLGKEVKQ